MDFGCRYAASPSGPSSRPRPLAFTPPKGEPTSGSYPLIPNEPVRTRRATPSPRSRSVCEHAAGDSVLGVRRACRCRAGRPCPRSGDRDVSVVGEHGDREPVFRSEERHRVGRSHLPSPYVDGELPARHTLVMSKLCSRLENPRRAACASTLGGAKFSIWVIVRAPTACRPALSPSNRRARGAAAPPILDVDVDEQPREENDELAAGRTLPFLRPDRHRDETAHRELVHGGDVAGQGSGATRRDQGQDDVVEGAAERPADVLELAELFEHHGPATRRARCQPFELGRPRVRCSACLW